MMIAKIIPMILAIEMLIVSPNVRTKIPRFNMIGSERPKDCPYPSQLREGISAVRLPIKPPKTIPVKINKNNAQLFLLAVPRIYPHLSSYRNFISSFILTIFPRKGKKKVQKLYPVLFPLL